LLGWLLAIAASAQKSELGTRRFAEQSSVIEKTSSVYPGLKFERTYATLGGSPRRIGHATRYLPAAASVESKQVVGNILSTLSESFCFKARATRMQRRLVTYRQ
jgi:hypothetical protein